jgi:acetoacetyl-CoA synthetase
MKTDQALWTPSPERIASANVTAFRLAAAQRWGVKLPDYHALYDWSVAHPEQFWVSVWEGDGIGSGVIGHRGETRAGRWRAHARRTLVPAGEAQLRPQPACARRDAADALVFWGEDRVKRRLSSARLYDQVSRFAAALKAAGVVAGDRVAGYLPNLPETLIAMLGTASLGAIWSSASPDFGVQGVVDRFGQIAPKVLVCADGYFYAGKAIDSLPRIAEIAAALPSVERVVVVGYTRSDFDIAPIRAALRFDEFLAPHAAGEIAFAQLAFDHPLFILYSSGTTGVPKCIVHGHGGVLLQHVKEHVLHTDVKPGDRLFYFTTCGWMMWNWLASGLAAGATLLLYDGSPFAGERATRVASSSTTPKPST